MIEKLGCITNGQKHLDFSLLLVVHVQMHWKRMTSQMQINNKEVKERDSPLRIKYVRYVPETTDKFLSCTLKDFTPAG